SCKAWTCVCNWIISLLTPHAGMVAANSVAKASMLTIRFIFIVATYDAGFCRRVNLRLSCNQDSASGQSCLALWMVENPGPTPAGQLEKKGGWNLHPPKQHLLLINEVPAAVLLPALFIAFRAEGL